jgi:hypothetical protein
MGWLIIILHIKTMGCLSRMEKRLDWIAPMIYKRGYYLHAQVLPIFYKLANKGKEFTKMSGIFRKFMNLMILFMIFIFLQDNCLCVSLSIGTLKFFNDDMEEKPSADVDVDYIQRRVSTQIGHSTYRVKPTGFYPMPLLETKSSYYFSETWWGAHFETPHLDLFTTPYSETGGYYSSTLTVQYNCNTVGEYLNGANFNGWPDGSWFDYSVQYTFPGGNPSNYTFNSFLRPEVNKQTQIHYTTFEHGGQTQYTPDNWDIQNETSHNSQLTREMGSVKPFPFPTRWDWDGAPDLEIQRISTPTVYDNNTSPIVGLYSHRFEQNVFSTTYTISPDETYLFFNSFNTYGPDGTPVVWNFDYFCPIYGYQVETATIEIQYATETVKVYGFSYDYVGYDYLPVEMKEIDPSEMITYTYRCEYVQPEDYPYMVPSMLKRTSPGDDPTTICQTVYDEDLTTPIARGSFFMWYSPPGSDGAFPRYSAGQEPNQYLYILDDKGNPLGHWFLNGQYPSLVVYAYDPEGKLTALLNLYIFPGGGYSESTQMMTMTLLQYDDLDRALSAIRIEDPYVDLYLFHYNARGYPDMIIDTSTAGVVHRVFGEYGEAITPTLALDRSVSANLFPIYGDPIPPVHKIPPYFPPPPKASDIVDCVLGKSPSSPYYDVNEDGDIDVGDLVTIIANTPGKGILGQGE